MFGLFKKNTTCKDLKWIGVDIHSHLLPGIDDGSPDAKTSLGYIRALKELGFDKLICTPHIFKEIYPNNEGSITDALTSLKQELQRNSIDIEISAAAEYMLNTDFDDLLKSNEKMMLLPGQHILVEMSYISETPNIEQHIFDLNIKGYKPILAHPERYVFYHKNFAQYRRLKDMGALLQVNILSFTGYYGKEIKAIAEKLLKDNLIDLIGTDLHHQKHLDTLKQFAENGKAYEVLGKYPFKNKELFSMAAV